MRNWVWKEIGWTLLAVVLQGIIAIATFCGFFVAAIGIGIREGFLWGKKALGNSWDKWELEPIIAYPAVLLFLCLCGYGYGYLILPVSEQTVGLTTKVSTPEGTIGDSATITEQVKIPSKGIKGKQSSISVPNVNQPKMPIRGAKEMPLNGMLVIIDAGHGGMTRWQKVDPGCAWTAFDQEFSEAAYTSRIAKELGERIITLGGDIVYTNWSSTMYVCTSPQDSMPLPSNPLLPNGAQLPNGNQGLGLRSKVARDCWTKYKGRYRIFAFVSIHIDSMPNGWSGLHVCYDKHASGAPRLAQLVAQGIERYHYGRQCNGTPKEILSAKGLAVLRNNPLKHRILIEYGIPGNEKDSWRLRNEGSRRIMIEKTTVQPLIKLMKERG